MSFRNDCSCFFYFAFVTFSVVVVVSSVFVHFYFCLQKLTTATSIASYSIISSFVFFCLFVFYLSRSRWLCRQVGS